MVDGSSWARVITPLETADVSPAPLPQTSLADDVVALNRSLEQTEGDRFEEIREAHREMEANEARGKMVVVHA
jgi:hypothetical protein